MHDIHDIHDFHVWESLEVQRFGCPEEMKIGWKTGIPVSVVLCVALGGTSVRESDCPSAKISLR
jgi:hypothetical protein